MLRGTGNEGGRGPLRNAAKRLRASAVLTGAAIAAAALALSGMSCGQSSPDLLTTEDGGPSTTGPVSTGCAVVTNTGCACSDEGAITPCGKVLQKQGNYTFCSNGSRTCSNGVWGTCLGGTLVTSSLPAGDLALSVESLGTQQLVDAAVCTDPNTPYIIPDQSGGIATGPGFAQAPDGGGLSLLVTMGSGVGCAMNPVVTPTPQNIVVTSISPTLVTSPASLTYTATCGVGGAVLAPSWTLSNYAIGTVTPSMTGLGVFTVYSPVATIETLTATSATYSGTGIANVTVNTNEVATGVPLAVPATFAVPVLADTNLTPLYPYSNTVFPLGLAAPTVQWDNKNTPATYVKISLRYPRAPAAQLFNWSIVLNGEPDGAVITGPYAHAPAYTIPQYAWSGFGSSAAGLVGQSEIAIQRIVGGVVRTEQTIPLTFATAPLNGTVYYVQYQRTVTNANASDSTVTNVTTPYKISYVCPVGDGTHVSSAGSQVYAVNPGAAGTPVDPFNGTAGCPVCHSVSGNGKTFMSVDHGIGIWPASSGNVKVGSCAIGAGGVFGSCVDVPDWTGVLGSDTPDWNSRGFSYNAMTYDGRYNVQASEFWGNSNDTPPTGAPTTTQNNAIGGASGVWNIYDNSSGAPVLVNGSVTGLNNAANTAGLYTMMTPSFSPDSTKLAYVNGDSGPGGATGWKKGLSVLPFNEATKAFSTPTLVVNTWAGGAGTGNPIKWPFFEYDSRSLIFVETSPQEYCLSGGGGIHDETNPLSVGCYQSSYGNMSPTTRSYWPGQLYSADSTMLNVTVPLTNLNNGPFGRADNGALYDKNKAYQPSALPFATGGYRWVIFTSQRAYGNQVNPYDYVNGVATDPSCAVGQLWIAAMDDAVSGAVDRSHPAFWLPNQRYAGLTVNQFVNERGYLVPAACAPTGTTSTSVCATNTDCCNGNCRIDLPAASPPTRHCAAASGTCSQPNQSCSVSSDCCNGATCVNGSCAFPPTYPPQTFTRLYASSCQSGYHPIWHLFQWYAAVPGNANITFSVQTNLNSDAGAFVPSTPILIGTATNANSVLPPTAPATVPPPTSSLDVDTTLKAAGLSDGTSILVTMVFNSTTPGNLATPVLYDWDMTFDCAASE